MAAISLLSLFLGVNNFNKAAVGLCIAKVVANFFGSSPDNVIPAEPVQAAQVAVVAQPPLVPPPELPGRHAARVIAEQAAARVAQRAHA